MLLAVLLGWTYPKIGVLPVSFSKTADVLFVLLFLLSVSVWLSAVC